MYLDLARLDRLHSPAQAEMSPPSPSGLSSFPADARVINGSIRALWHKSAPRAVRRAFASGDRLASFDAWKRYLARRERPADPDQLLAGDALSWALPDALDPPPGPDWLHRAEKLLRRRPTADSTLEKELLCWLGESVGAAANAPYAVEIVACCRALARLAAVFSPEAWWALLDHLLATVADAQVPQPQADPLVQQLLAGEAALTLAYLLPEITPCRKLKSSARRVLSAGLVDLLDGEGLPHSEHIGLLRPLLACWTRCRALGAELNGGCLSKAAAVQYEWLVRQTLRLARHDGSHVFSRGPSGGFNRRLFAAALRFGGDRDDHNVAAVTLPPNKEPRQRRADPAALPEPAGHSEWAAAAVLRPGWSRSDQRLTVLYPEQQVHVELGCGKDLLFSGLWELEVRVDGRTASADSEWEQLCWISDDDVDFLELEIELSGQLRVQRQMLLGRQDRFLLLADVVLGVDPGRLEYRSRLPLGPGVSFRAAGRTREGLLVGSKPRALVLPLALPEWQSDQRVGQLVQTAGGLELHQAAEASGLYAPLFFDLNRRRITRKATWRQLTVAESLAAQPHEVAVGYRVAVGKHQWLIYRSLAENANRTLLGHNLSTEMLVAQFHRSGEVEPLLEIE